MDGMKFDLRVYVLVSSCDPLRIYVFNEGLVRLATVDYVDPTTTNTEEVCMHLTNYAINKHNENFVRPTGAQADDSSEASKRSFAFFRQWLDENNLPKEQIFKDMHDVVTKTIITAHPILKHNYRTCFPQPWRGSACFEILGFDILIDRKLKPWLLEVNHSPSFHTDSKLDKQIKTALIHDTMISLDLRLNDRKRCIDEDKKRVQARLTNPKSESREVKAEKMKNATDDWIKQMEKFEQKNIGGYERIYPPEDQEECKKYAAFFNSSASVFQTTAAQRAREEAARIQLEEIRLKNEIEQAKRQGKPIPSIHGNKGESGIDTPTRPTTRSINRTTSLRTTNLRNVRSKYRRPEPPPVDILLPIAITDTEENERKFQLRQRAAQIKSLGIVDLVYRFLQASQNLFNERHAQQPSQAVGEMNNQKGKKPGDEEQNSKIMTQSGAAAVVDKLAKKKSESLSKHKNITSKKDPTTKSIISYFSSLDYQEIPDSLKTLPSSQSSKNLTSFQHFQPTMQPPSIPTLQNAWRRQNQPHFALTIKQLSTKSLTGLDCEKISGNSSALVNKNPGSTGNSGNTKNSNNSIPQGTKAYYWN